MIEYYLSWGIQAEKAFRYVYSTNIPKIDITEISNIVFIGMGGSGIVGDLAASLAYNRLGVPVFSIKDYRLPMWVNKNTLVISISYSGNTRETVLATYEALKRGSHVITVSSGGILRRLSEKYNLPHISIEGGLVPRAALPAMLYTVLALLERMGFTIVSKDEINRSIENLKLWCNSREVDSEAKDLATFLKESIPVVVSCSKFSPLAYRLKNEFNENSKIPVKVEIVPEWGHNDIVGWEKPPATSNMKCLIVNCNEDKCKHLLNFVKEAISRVNIKCYTLNLKGDSDLNKLMYGCLVGGLASVYLARFRGVNPIETTSISMYKNIIVKLIKINIV
ncbi:MAG TPA: bifunctional phosphoglucose/phosphomannose isomerase [Desulfurococcales archaeon]|nr:bifunctional phosphoglucose/phosphomannose isomerase [Desulfurococcales archaeon]